MIIALLFCVGPAVVRAIGELVDAVATGPAATAPEQPTPAPTFARAWATVPAC